MRAGNLRHKITIQQTTESRTGTGAVVDTWGTYITRRAAIRTLNAREIHETNTDQAVYNLEIKLRYDAQTKAITEKMRVSWDGRLFDINGAINVNERDRTVLLHCREVK